MNKIINLLKSNLKYIILFVIFISFFFINFNVVHFGDDYWFLRFQNTNLGEVFSNLINFYYTTNGRFIVHLLVIIFLKLPLFFWQTLNSLFLTGICYYVSKILTDKNKDKQVLILALMFLFIATLEISITRQSVYWLTGSFNYVYPIVLLFAYCYFLTKIENKKYFIVTIILAFLSSATMEQCAMMTFGLTVLILLSKFKNLKNIKSTVKENKKLVILLIITFIGTCTVLLSPAQFVRIGNETKDFSLLSGIINNIKFLLTYYTRSVTALIYAIVFNILTILYVNQNGNNKEKHIIYISALSNISLIILNMFATYTQNEFLKLFIMFLIVITYSINLIYLNYKIYKKTLINPITIALILMLGSQVMMIISPVIGQRNLIFGFIMLAFIICIIANQISIKYNRTIVLLLIILALLANLQTAVGYAKNKYIDKENFKIITSTPNEVLTNENANITLHKFKDDNYGWSLLYESDSHLEYFKELYDIKCNFNWK